MRQLVWRGNTWDVDEDPILIGRDPVACDVSIEEDSLLSRIHFALVPGPDAVFLVDLRSSNGTYVNESRVHYSRLQDGDEIQAGSGRFAFRDTSPAGARTRLLPEPNVSLLTGTGTDPLLRLLRRVREARHRGEAMQAAAEELVRAAGQQGVPEPAAFALSMEGDDPVSLGIAGAPPEHLAELVGPLVLRVRVLHHAFLVEEIREDPSFLPPGYPIRLRGVGSLAVQPLGDDHAEGFLCLTTTRPGERLGPAEIRLVEVYGRVLELQMRSLPARETLAPR